MHLVPKCEQNVSQGFHNRQASYHDETLDEIPRLLNNAMTANEESDRSQIPIVLGELLRRSTERNLHQRAIFGCYRKILLLKRKSLDCCCGFRSVKEDRSWEHGRALKSPRCSEGSVPAGSAPARKYGAHSSTRSNRRLEGQLSQ